MPGSGDRSRWTFLSNHALVLLCVAGEADTRIRDIALQVGITERTAQLILRDLEEAGYVEVTRIGRRNRYRVQREGLLRHPLNADHSVGELLRALEPKRG